MGMLTCDENEDVLNPQNWHKSSTPVFQSDTNHHQYGPGHNSFTIAEDGETDLMVYHCRNYTDIKGDPLYDPNRHTIVKSFTYSSDGTPILASLFHTAIFNKERNVYLWIKQRVQQLSLKIVVKIFGDSQLPTLVTSSHGQLFLDI